jgi:hypothetical protein
MNNIESISSASTFPPYNYLIGGSMNKSESLASIASALSKAQSEMEAAKKGEEGYGYNYADLATVIAAAKPILAKHGLAVTQLVGQTVNNSVNVTTILTHDSGEFIQSDASLPLIDMKGCNAAQNAGASLSYLRRYAYQAIIGQPSEDNDASSGGFKKPEKKAARKAPTKTEDKKSTTTPTASKSNRFRKNKVQS